MPISVVAGSKKWICGRSLAGIAGSNPAGNMDACLMWVLCYVRWRSLWQADHSSRGVLPSVEGLSVISQPQHWGLGPFGLSSHEKLYNYNYYLLIIIVSNVTTKTGARLVRAVIILLLLLLLLLLLMWRIKLFVTVRNGLTIPQVAYHFATRR
jgi:hypothetical protein